MAIMEKILPNGILIGIDQDRDAIENAERIFNAHRANIHLFHGNFAQLPKILAQHGISAVDGILADLGVSQHHYTSSGRGFSFNRDEPLDMRMDTREPLTAEAIVNRMSAKELKRVFSEYGEERYAGRIAERIVRDRAVQPISSSMDLTGTILRAVPASARFKQSIHPATRVFMALRIAVNREIEQLQTFMQSAAEFLNPQGRLCILSFHSLEDRIVKRRFRALASGCDCPPDFPQCVCGKEAVVRILTKKPRRPTEEEVKANPMARSARLRAAERLA